MAASRELGTSPRRVETLLIRTTSKNLGEEIGAGKFRADLYYYINVLRLRLPCTLADLLSHGFEFN